jgi:hypothetical protein
VQFFLDFAAARELAQECQRCADKVGDAFGADLGLCLEALALTNGNRHDEAIPLHREVLDGSRRRGDRVFASFALSGLVYAELRHDVPAAVRMAGGALRLAEPLGDDARASPTYRSAPACS